MARASRRGGDKDARFRPPGSRRRGARSATPKAPETTPLTWEFDDGLAGSAIDPTTGAPAPTPGLANPDLPPPPTTSALDGLDYGSTSTWAPSPPPPPATPDSDSKPRARKTRARKPSARKPSARRTSSTNQRRAPGTSTSATKPGTSPDRWPGKPRRNAPGTSRSKLADRITIILVVGGLLAFAIITRLLPHSAPARPSVTNVTASGTIATGPTARPTATPAPLPTAAPASVQDVDPYLFALYATSYGSGFTLYQEGELEAAVSQITAEAGSSTVSWLAIDSYTLSANLYSPADDAFRHITYTSTGSGTPTVLIQPLAQQPSEWQSFDLQDLDLLELRQLAGWGYFQYWWPGKPVTQPALTVLVPATGAALEVRCYPDPAPDRGEVWLALDGTVLLNSVPVE